MKELQEILKKLDSLPPDENAVLATVVDVKGSSYRLPGAKMLILEDGSSCGTVSGGCLEADVLERAETVIESGEAQIYTYDTRTNDDSVFSFNMGCRGVIRILLEPIRNNPFVQFMRVCFEKERGLSATSIGSGEDGAVGDRVFFVGDGVGQNEFIDERICNHAVQALKAGSSRIEEYDFGEVFFDYIAPPVNLTIFGAGADAVPLAKIAKELGWYVTVVDHRPALANNERFEDPDKIVLAGPEEIGKKVYLNFDSIAVVMTHNYDHDKEIIRHLIKRNLKYLGLLGPKVRTESIFREFHEEGFEVSESEIGALYGPVGLDIGAELPETIALAIVAEIQSILAGRNGGFLKDRKGSIYGRD